MLILLNGSLIILFLENVVVKLFASSTDVSKIPLKAYNNSAGYDLFSDETVKVLSNSRALISTDLQMDIPKGYYAQIVPRSGLALKNGVVAFNGTIDSGYLGVICVLLFNFSSKDYLVEKGNRIAQIIFKKCEEVSFSLGTLEYFDCNTERGVKGFGSSGV